MTGPDLRQYLYSWNPAPPADLTKVRIEDDARETLQSAQVHRPSLPQRKQMLDVSAQAGVDVTFLGFPAASSQEEAQCADLVAHISGRALPLAPVLMARALPADLRPLMDIQQRTSTAVIADIYLSTSPLRALVEGWDLPTMLQRLVTAADLATAEGLAFRVAFEDSTRTPAADLAACVRTALSVGAQSIVLNDTAGDCFPQGARQHVAFVADQIAEAGAGTKLAWHGHNDRGLALANSLAAIDGGAELISGTFLGIGERTGNLALEQLMVILAEAGSTRYDPRQLVVMRDLIAASMHIDVPAHQPILGADAFRTATGTHAAAILKAQYLGRDFADAVYSAVSAASLGRHQELLISANSGRAGVKAVLDQLQLPSYGAAVDAVLAYAKSQPHTLFTEQDIRRGLPARSADKLPSAGAAVDDHV